MREIKFRGLDHGGEWRIGSLVIEEGAYFIYNPSPERVRVEIDSKTIGQYTNIKDKNGKEIYEGDIIYSNSWWWGAKFIFLSSGEVGPARGDNVFQYILSQDMENPLKGATHNLWYGKDVEIIGNIYQTPELINANAR